jgi:hypothetical protein
VTADKQREVAAGHDGTWVAHPDLVRLATAIFNEQMPQPNQLYRCGLALGLLPPLLALLLPAAWPWRASHAGAAAALPASPGRRVPRPEPRPALIRPLPPPPPRGAPPGGARTWQ